MNKRVFMSVKEWMDNLIRIHNELIEIQEFSNDVVAGLPEYPGRIRIFNGIEKAAKSVARTIEIRETKDGFIEKSFIYRGIVFFQVNNQKNGEKNDN